ncbi:hypothetical protein RhiJN_15275 [Ceratobasidium sp. AG-Ba]|nr:hypothetical protein RhiJN_15275 [Ceratobasidium sp. AG-Ba]
MSAADKKAQRTPVARILCRAGWLLGCALTLGYAPKYYLKVTAWQAYDPTTKDEQRRPYIRQLTSRDLKMPTSIRAKQQKEWDRLMTPLSVITATAAAALAIESPFGTSQIFWLATAFFSAAFGLSLEGLIIITYLTVFGAGSTAETIGRIANGKEFLHGFVGPVAIITALPTAITTYSSIFLLIGLLAMTIAADEESDVQHHMAAFKIIVLVPVCLMLLCLICTVTGCEYFAWKEREARLAKLQQRNDTDPENRGGVQTEEPSIVDPSLHSPVYNNEPEDILAATGATRRVTF